MRHLRMCLETRLGIKVYIYFLYINSTSANFILYINILGRFMTSARLVIGLLHSAAIVVTSTWEAKFVVRKVHCRS